MERFAELSACMFTRKAHYLEALLGAIEREDLIEIKDIATEMVAHNADMSEVTALHAAARRNNQTMIEILLQCGLAIDEMNVCGNTALHTACEYRCEASVETLLKWGSNTKVKNMIDCFPLESMIHYAKNNRLMLEPSSITEEELHSSQVEFEEVRRIVKLFLKYRGRFNDKNMDDRKIVRTIILYGPPRMANFFAENGFDLSVVDDGGFNMLHDAARDGNWEAVAELVQYIEPNCISRCSKTPLHEAASRGSPKCVHILLTNGAKIDPLDAHKETPLCKALLCTSLWAAQVVERLLHNRPSMDHIMHSISDSSKEFQEAFEGDPRKQEALIRHVLKMKAAGIHVGDEKVILDFLNAANDGQTSIFLTSHTKEVIGMMKTMLVSNFSAYDFLTKNIDDVVWYLNPGLSAFLEARSYAIKFPLYADYLEAVHHRASKRREMLEKGGPTLSNMLATRGMPEPCIRNVLAYLTDLDLDYVVNFAKIHKEK